MEGQVSTEYMTIIIIGILFITSIYVYYLYYLSISAKDIQMKKTINKIGREIDYLCNFDNGSKKDVWVFIPVNVKETIWDNRSITIRTNIGDFTHLAKCFINVTGNFTYGPNTIYLKNLNGIIQVVINP